MMDTRHGRDGFSVPGLRRRQLKSLALNREVARRLRRDPETVLARARGTLAKMRRRHGAGPDPDLAAWERLLDGPIETLLDVLTRDDERCAELRRGGPFAGVVPEPVRQWLLRGFVAEYDAFVARHGRPPAPADLAVMEAVVPRPSAYERAVTELLRTIDAFIKARTTVAVTGTAALCFQGAGEPLPAVELLFRDRVHLQDLLLTYVDEAGRKQAVFPFACPLPEGAFARSAPMELDAGRLAVRLAVPDPDEPPRFPWLDPVREWGIPPPAPETAQAAFERVCRNELEQREAPEAMCVERQAQAAMCVVRNAMRSHGWAPDLSALTGPALRRGGYLAELFALLGRWPGELRCALLAQLPDPQRLDGPAPMPFFDGERKQGYDALAERWGIVRGWDLRKTWQILHVGSC